MPSSVQAQKSGRKKRNRVLGIDDEATESTNRSAVSTRRDVVSRSDGGTPEGESSADSDEGDNQPDGEQRRGNARLRLRSGGTREPRSRGWCITVNNWTEEDERLLRGLYDTQGATFVVWQREIGERGTKHLQVCGLN